MLFYLSIFFIVLLLMIFKKKNNNINVIIVFGLLTLLYGSRDYGGVDDITYISAFASALNGEAVYGIEGSFYLMSQVLGELNFNYKAIFLVYAIISFSFMYFAYSELCKDRYQWLIVMLGFLVFAFVPTITLMRQFTAASILTFAFILKFKKKNKASLILIGLASLIHVGSVLGFLIFPLISIKFKKRLKILIPLICLFIGYSGLFNDLLNLFEILIPNKYLGYLGNSSSQPDIGILHLILLVLYLFQFGFDIISKNASYDKTIYFLENAQMFYFSIYFITLSSGWINRLSIYFILFLPFIFITFIKRFSIEKEKKLLYLVFSGACMSLFIYVLINLNTNMSELIPYKGSFSFLK